MVFLGSCSSDDECTPETVAGTYNLQSAECDPEPDEAMESLSSLENSASFTVTAVDENTISIVGEDGEAIEFPLNGCEFSFEPETVDFFGLNFTVSYSGEFNGDELQIIISSSVSGEIEGQDPIDPFNSTCTVVASR